MDQYILHHKKPYSKFLSIREFNSKFGTNITENSGYEHYFQAAFDYAKRTQGPDDFLQIKFMSQEDFVELTGSKNWSHKIGKMFGMDADKVDELKRKASKKLNDVKRKVMKSEKVQEEKAQVVESLDELLSDEVEKEVVEEEYEEEEAPEVKSEVRNIVTEKKKITDLVQATSENFSQDMKHLIQFKNSSLPLEEQLMKGRPRYLKAIKAYIRGDKNAEVKMSWSKKNKKKMVKLADLNPQIDSLKALLRSSPNGLRVVECV